MAAALLAAGCSSGASGGAKGPSGALTFEVLQAFTGASAFEGPEQMAGCLAGVAVVNAAGGVLGHKLRCGATDDTGDPADAVPATNKMLASTSNLVAVIGPAETAPVTVPLITNFHIPMFSDSGDPEFDHNKDPYYFRIDPSDSLAGIAMAYWGYKHYGTKAVASFTNDPGAQTTVPSLLAEYRRLGGTIVHNQALVPHQTSYRTEILTLLGDHPKVVFTEMDPQTAGTFWGEVRQLDNGTTPPVLATTLATKSAYIQAVTGAIGSSLFGSHFAAVSPLNPVGPSYASFKAALLKEGSAVRNPGQYLSDPYTIADYDSVIVASLAMTEAKSTTPSVWRPFILKVAGSGSGSTLVHTYTAGLQAIHAGKSVSYVGAYGPFYFNRYQNASGEFAIFRWNPATHTDKQVGLVTLREMQALTGS